MVKSITLLLFTILHLSEFSYAQKSTQRVDSLKFELADATSDSSRSIILAELSYRYYTNPDSCYAIAQRGLLLATKIGFEKGIAANKFSLGSYYSNTGDYVKALTNLDEALVITKKYGDKKLSARIYLSLGIIQGEEENYNKAITSFKKSYDLFNNLNDTDGVILNLNNLGYCFLKIKSYDSSQNYLEKGLFHAKKTKLVSQMSFILGSLGELHLARNNPSKSKEYILKSIKLNDGLDLNLQSDNYIILAKIHGELGNKDAAFIAAQKAFDLAVKSQSMARKKSSCELLSSLYSSSGEYKESLEYLRTSITISDSLFSIEKTKQEAKLISRLEEQETDTKIKMLKQESELRHTRLQLQEAEILRKNYMLGGFIVLMILLVWMLISLLRESKRKKKSMKMIRRKNNEIQAQANELAALNAKLLTLNETLEVQAEERATKILEQTRKMNEYAFINSHKLRAPVATILGMINLIDARYVDEAEQRNFLSAIQVEIKKIDLIVREINISIE